MSSLKIIHNHKNCIGCNACVLIAPQSWRMNQKTGKSELIGAEKKGNLFITDIFECDKQANQDAAEACPMNIIKISS